MPAMASRGRGRRTINEINMVPFIDVMLVLLIIFMVTAPMLTPGMIDTPKIGKSAKPPKTFGVVIIDKDGSISLKTDGSERPVALKDLGATAKSWQLGVKGEIVPPVLISADKSVQYEAVVKAMDALQKAGVQRVGLSVKQGG